MGIHDGHRARLKKTFNNCGLDGFSEIQTLELLLFFARPRVDTNPIAHALIDRFKTVSGVFNASYEELTEVEGVGESGATLIRLVPAIIRKSAEKEKRSKEQITNPVRASAYLIPKFMFENNEQAYLLCLDANKRVISCEQIGSGVVNTVDLNARLIAETALRAKATSVILSHNHPDGNTEPSRDDISTTAQLKKSLSVLGINLDDHIIISEDRFTSMCELGYI